MFLLSQWVPDGGVGASGYGGYGHGSDVSAFVGVVGGDAGEVPSRSFPLESELRGWNHVVMAGPVRGLVQLCSGKTEIKRQEIYDLLDLLLC